MDTFKNFAIGQLSTGYDDTATSIELATGQGARFPSSPFNAIWYNSTDYSNAADDPNAEVIRVTARTSDTLTILRAQENTAATVKNLGGKTYTLFQGVTADALNSVTDILDNVKQAQRIVKFGIGAATSLVIPYDSSVPQSGEGAAYSSFDTTIIPDNAASTLEFYVHIAGSANGVAQHRNIFAFFKDDETNASAVVSHTAQYDFSAAGYFELPAESTASRTYKMRFGPDSGIRTTTIESSGSSTFAGTKRTYLIVIERLP